MREGGNEWINKFFRLQICDLRTRPYTKGHSCPILISVVMTFALLKQAFFPWIIFIEKSEANIEIIIDSHSSSPCSLSPTSSWEPVAEFLGTTGSKSTNHLKCSYKNRPVSSCGRASFLRANIAKKFYLFLGYATSNQINPSRIYLNRLRILFWNSLPLTGLSLEQTAHFLFPCYCFYIKMIRWTQIRAWGTTGIF